MKYMRAHTHIDIIRSMHSAIISMTPSDHHPSFSRSQNVLKTVVITASYIAIYSFHLQQAVLLSRLAI